MTASPYRIVSIHPGDAATIRALTPFKAGSNTFDTLRAAAGVCRDIRRHLVDTRARIVDAHGNDVPDDQWSADLTDARGSKS